MTTPPWVVGTTRPQGLAALAASRSLDDALPDLVEARLDLWDSPSGGGGPSDLAAVWSSLSEPALQLESRGCGVLVTMRLVADGGRWTEDAGRLSWFEQAAAVASWLDIELESTIARAVVSAAHTHHLSVIVSHHDLTGTPSAGTLADLARGALELGADIVKIATLVNSLEDHAVLVDFVHENRRANRPVAVIAMGPLGTALRSYLPCIGSRLTYGHLDGPVAPGQIPARALMERLMDDCPAYASFRRAGR